MSHSPAQQAKSPNAPSDFLNVGSVATRVKKVASFLKRTADTVAERVLVRREGMGDFVPH